MPELLTPGVYVQEVAFGPEPIEGVSTTTAGFVGEAQWGPTEGAPVLVTSFSDYERKFGRFVSGKYLPYAVRGFFENGGRRAYVARVVGAAALAATVQTTEGYDTDLESSVSYTFDNTTGSPAPETFTIKVGSVVGLQAGDPVKFITLAGNDADPSLPAITVDKIDALAGTLEVQLTVPANTKVIVGPFSPATHAVRYATPGTSSNRVKFTAKYKGAFGSTLAVRLTAMYLSGTLIGGTVTAPNIPLASVDGVAVGMTLEFAQGQDRFYGRVTGVDTASRTVQVTGPYPFTPVVGDPVRVVGWRLDVFAGTQLVESLDKLSSDNAALETAVSERSSYVTLTTSAGFGIDLASVSPSTYAHFLAGQPVVLTGGSDGTANKTDIVGTDVPPRTGLKSLEAQEGVNIIAVPGWTKQDVVNELIGQAERRKDRFAVFESDCSGAAPLEAVAVLNERAKYNSKYAAMYHPWVNVLDPLTNTDVKMPPSGHVIGCYARTDIDRGVFKAPANVVIRSISGFSQDVPDGEQDILNPAGVDVLRHFDGLGDVIWGARTISSEGLWKYVSVRRLFIFLEQSIIRGTRYAVFEPNDQQLWARIHDSVTNFLTTQWRAGALFGSKPEEAFFVKVDETTTTQDDRDNGIVNILVGIAPVKPAEFIVFQIGQAATSIIIAERGA